MTDPIEVMARAFYAGSEIGWASLLPSKRSEFANDARRVLTALAAAGLKVLPREPTEQMLTAGYATSLEDHDVGPEASTWRAMWDAAVAEKP